MLFDPDISEERLTFPGIKLPVCLYTDEARNNILYADKAGYSADFDYSQSTSIIAVYSPIGGSGKTTVALAIASKLTNMGKTVLFLSAEQLSSSSCMNPMQEDGITALVEGAADEHVNFELKVKGLMKQGANNMLYIEEFEKFVDYDAVTNDEMSDVLTRVRRCGICDYMEDLQDSYMEDATDFDMRVVMGQYLRQIDK